MKVNALYRQQLIESMTPQPTEHTVDAARRLWEAMAAQIILIVGESGFNSLYERALSLLQPTYPWLIANSQSAQADNRFSELLIILERQSPEQARTANNQLLIMFTDILASLIGEDLTNHILQIAWGVNAADLNCQEVRNEQ